MKYRAALSLIFIALLPGVCVAAERIGQTYEVIEVDPVAYIKKRSVDFDYAAYQKEKVAQSINALRAQPLPRTQASEISYHRVMHTVERDVIDANGNVIYPTGYEYNALDYVTWSFRVFVLDEEDIDRFSGEIQPHDVVLINQGRIFEAQKALNMPVYVIDTKTQAALKVSTVPSIVSQSGNQLKIEAIHYE